MGLSAGDFTLSTIILVLLSISRAVAELPPYSGPHGVGTIYLENPAQDPRSITNLTLKSNGKPAFNLDTVLIAVFYPTDTSARSTKPAHPWLPEPRNLIAQGLSQSIGGSVDPGLIQLGFNIFAKDLTIPAQVDVSILAGSEKFPVMIFSHGNPTLSDWYSGIYGEMASRGVVVAAVTHRDGSSPATVVKFQNGTSFNLVGYTESAVNPALSGADFHQQQLEMRNAELSEAARVLQDITNGDGQKIYSSSSRGEGADISNWKDRLDLSKLIIAGHSFGANTVLRYLQDAQSKFPAAAAIAFDPGKESGPLPTDTFRTPLLIPDSNEWSAIRTEFYGRQHFDVVKDIATRALGASGNAWFMTLLGTVHSSITDVSLISTGFAKFFTNSTDLITLDPAFAIKQYVNVTSSLVTFLQNKTATGLLNTGVTYPTFRLIPNASILSTPWEVHVAPNKTGKTSMGCRGFTVPDFLQLLTGPVIAIGGVLLLL